MPKGHVFYDPGEDFHFDMWEVEMRQRYGDGLAQTVSGLELNDPEPSDVDLDPGFE